MGFDFDHIVDRRQSDSVKWHRYGADVLPLWVADMDFISPQPVLDALHRRVEAGVFGYPFVDEGLRQVVVDRLAALYGWEVSPAHLVLASGVVAGFAQAARALVSPQEGILVQPPVYHPILNLAERIQVRPINAGLVLRSDGSYALDFDAFEAAAASGARMFILCNPHNPVGKVFKKDELERLAEICLRHEVIICSDEIHAELIYPGQRHVPIACLDEEIAQNTITLLAPSKTFNLPGLQCSFAVIPNDELRERYTGYSGGPFGWVNVMGMAAAEAAYRQCDAWLDALMGYLTANRDHTWDFVRDNLPGVKMWKPEGTYLAWLDCREAGIPGNPFEFFLEHARVALEDGAKFGLGGDGFVRLNFACPRATLDEALLRMHAALGDL